MLLFISNLQRDIEDKIVVEDKILVLVETCSKILVLIFISHYLLLSSISYCKILVLVVISYYLFLSSTTILQQDIEDKIRVLITIY